MKKLPAFPEVPADEQTPWVVALLGIIEKLPLIELTIYFGDALLESADGLEAVYQRLLALESEIRQEVLFGAAWVDGHRLSARFIDTLFDEDRLPHYKMMASRFEVEG